MKHRATTSKLSQRLAGARTRWSAAKRPSLGETFAVGLGCDTWKPRSL